MLQTSAHQSQNLASQNELQHAMLMVFSRSDVDSTSLHSASYDRLQVTMFSPNQTLLLSLMQLWHKLMPPGLNEE